MAPNMRQVIVTTIRPALTILLVGGALICGPRSVKTEFSPALVDARGRPSLGYLEHRGEMCDLRDWSLGTYGPDEKNRTFAHFAVGPTIADDGSGFYLVTATLPSVDLQFQMFGFGLEDLEEEQCVELSDLDGPILPGLRLVYPE